ncbi:hypothetical protein JL09_g4089 [Pichia kudriavzevii]|uniref:Uncharacterized protein n=1 Tax=Pichia kudriavzevii TaxID=4909 RepID=A0A099NXV1_PICKU|nr:hypothetical protein JL09_g4089 [Pichia kudriavzevii]
MASNDGLTASKIFITISYILSVFGSLFYLLPHLNDKHFLTPFSGTFIVTAIFWILTLLLQFVFITKVLFNNNVSPSNQSSAIAVIGPHFTTSNILHFFWCYFFSRERFVISEILLIVNLLNQLTLYFSHKTIAIKSLPDWLTVHLPVTGTPLAWSLYAILWNGATMFHSHNKSLLPRLLANIFIWELFVVPMALLVFYKDWSVGLATSFLALGMGFGQMFTKLVALQWIFAFVIAGANFTFSVLSMFNSAVAQSQTTTSTDQAPLLA